MQRLIQGFIGWVEVHPRWTVALVGGITALFVGILLTKGLSFQTDFRKFLPSDDPAVHRLEQAEATYGSQDLFLISIESETTIFKPSTLRKFKELETRLTEIAGVEDVKGPATADVIYGTEDSIVVEPAMEHVPQSSAEIKRYRSRVMGDRTIRGWLISEDGKAGAISITLEDWADAPTVVNEIRSLVRQYDGPETFHLVGEPVLRTAVAQTMVRDLRVLVPVVVLVLALVLWVSFRSAAGVLLPMLVVGLSTLWAVGSMSLAGAPMTPFAIVMPVMLIAIGAADGIHILNKYYESAARYADDTGPSRRAAVFNTMNEMAVPIILTSLTTAMGFVALLASFLWPQRHFGVFTALGIVYAMVLSLTLIPAFLSRLPMPTLSPADYQHSRISNALGGWARAVRFKPMLTLGIASVVLVACAVGIPRLNVETRADEFLGQGHPVVQSMYAMDERFGGSYQLAVEIDTGRRNGLKDPQVLKKIARLQDYLKSRPEIGQVMSVASIVRQLNETLHASDPDYYRIPEDPRLASQLFILYGGEPGKLFRGDFSQGEVIARRLNVGSTQMAALVADVRDYLRTHFSGPDDPKAQLVGPTQAYTALLSRIIQSQLASLSASFVTAGIIVSILMGSIMAGLLCLVPLVLTILVEFGVMAYASIPLDMATIMLGSIAIGIGIDYAIHFLHRFRLETRAGRDANSAFDGSMRSVGRGIAYNALALMFGFAVLLASRFHGLVTFGLLLVLTMIVSSLSSFSVIPAFLLIRRPSFLKRPSPVWPELPTDVAHPVDRQDS